MAFVSIPDPWRDEDYWPRYDGDPDSRPGGADFGPYCGADSDEYWNFEPKELTP